MTNWQLLNGDFQTEQILHNIFTFNNNISPVKSEPIQVLVFYGTPVPALILSLHPWPRHFNQFPPLFHFIYSTVKLSVVMWEWCIWNPPVIHSLTRLQAPQWFHPGWLNGILVSRNFNYTVHRKECNKKIKNKNTLGPTFLLHSKSTGFVCSSNMDPSIRWEGAAHCVVWCCWLHSQCTRTSPGTAAHSGPGSTLS